jgi:hypothetical protein
MLVDGRKTTGAKQRADFLPNGSDAILSQQLGGTGAMRARDCAALKAHPEIVVRMGSARWRFADG